MGGFGADLVPASRNLSRWADQGDIEMITSKWNGGLNGFDDRVVHLSRLSLSLLGFAPDALRQFQAIRGLQVDADPSPKSRAALHAVMIALKPGEAVKPKAGFAGYRREDSCRYTPKDGRAVVEIQGGAVANRGWRAD